MKTILDCGIFLAKPNLGELAGLVGTEELDAHSAIDAAKSVINNGKCEVLVVSMGAFGALLVTANEVFHSPSPAVKRKSTVGAGDSMVAGLITGFTKGLSLKTYYDMVSPAEQRQHLIQERPCAILKMLKEFTRNC